MPVARLNRGEWRPALPLALVLGGCSRSPSQSVFGSFFPSWLICAGLGVLAALLAWRLLVLVRVADEVPLAPMTYTAFAAAAALLFWLIRFGN